MRRLVARAGRGVALVVALYLILSLVLPLVPGTRAALPSGDAVRIGLLAGPIHYDFLVPLTPGVRQRFAFAVAGGVPVDDPAAEWLILGHGGRAFYTTVGTYADVTAGALWKGVTGDTSVMRLDVAGPVRQDIGIRWLSLSPEQLDAFVDAVLADFAEPRQRLPGPGLGDSDVFFPGADRSDILRTCNAWVGETLRAAGVRFGLWTPATWSVRLSLWRFAPG
jgi:uncharacterized protein (TIGR02117 family)